MIPRIVEILASARQRKAMYMATVDVPSARAFLDGFETGCFACGFQVSLEVREHVTTQRGWEWNAKGPVEEMRRRGLDELKIVDELFAIEIAAWNVLNG